jgi:hypothetical protein
MFTYCLFAIVIVVVIVEESNELKLPRSLSIYRFLVERKLTFNEWLTKW